MKIKYKRNEYTVEYRMISQGQSVEIISIRRGHRRLRYMPMKMISFITKLILNKRLSTLVHSENLYAK